MQKKCRLRVSSFIYQTKQGNLNNLISVFLEYNFCLIAIYLQIDIQMFFAKLPFQTMNRVIWIKELDMNLD